MQGSFKSDDQEVSTMRKGLTEIVYIYWTEADQWADLKLIQSEA